MWEGQPYRIHAPLAIDAPGDLAEQLAAELPAYLNDRVNTSIGIVWRLKTELATGPLRHQLLSGIDSFTTDDVAEGAADEDKRLLLSVRATPWGYELAAREFDRYVQRWGPTIRRTDAPARCRAGTTLRTGGADRRAAGAGPPRSERSAARRVRSARRRSAAQRCGFRLDQAGRRVPADPAPHDARRPARADGATTVPWTYLEVIAPTAGAAQPIGRIRSATQRPLAVRRGRIEQVAIGLRGDPGDSTVRLQARTEPDKPLVGYEVFAQNLDEKPMRLVGQSDGAGEVVVTPGKTPMQMLFVKSDGVFLARVPIVPGDGTPRRSAAAG